MDTFGKSVSGILGVVLLMLAAGLSLWLRWSNIDMTQRRIVLEFPWHCLAEVVCAVLGAIFLVLAGLGVDLRRRGW